MFLKPKKDKKLLDVKARSKAVKTVRLRMAASALAVSAGLVLVLLTVWKGGEVLLDEFVYRNPAFAIEKVQIQTDGIIPVGQIQSWANVRRGQNLLAVDLGQIKRNLELVPLIEAASVERILPRQLVIRVSEREPVAKVVLFQANGPDGLLQPSTFYLDYDGMVIPPVLRALNTSAFDAATRYLPTLTGINTIELRPGHKIRNQQVLAALQWLKAFRTSDMSGVVEIRGVDLSSSVTLNVLTEQGAEVCFAPRHFEPQLARWRTVHQFGLAQHRVIATLDLAVTNYVPALWLEVTNAPPRLLRDNPSPYRKRNV